MRRFFFVILITLSSFSLWGQETKSIIPYTIVGNKMIVEMLLNGSPQRLIFDTGGRTTITQKLMTELGLSVTDSLQVVDVNSQKATYKLTTLRSIATGQKGADFTGFSALVLPDASSFECYGAVGLIGSELFRKGVVEIDPKTKTISVSSSELPVKASVRTKHDFAGRETMPVFELNFADKTISVLFDTGYGGFLNLKNGDFKELSLQPISETLAEGTIGVGGKADAALSYRVNFATINLGGAKYKNVIAETGNPPFTLLGMKLLDHCKVTIDYSKRKIYFESQQKENDMTRPINDFGIAVKDGKLTISTVWSSMRGVVSDGDIITHINGKAVKKNYDFCESITVGISEIKEKPTAVLTVKTKKGVKKINYLN